MKPLPPLTEADWRNLCQMLLGLTILGAVDIEIHPSRWPLIVEASRRFGGSIPNDADLAAIKVLPLDLEVDDLPIRAWVRCWEPCPRPIEECPSCAAILAQKYPEPEEEQVIEVPRPSPIILPGDPRARGRGKLH